MSFIYPRTISVRRPNTAAVGTVGAIKFSGDDPVAETVIASGLRASIQYDRLGERPHAQLPTDSRRGQWKIFIPSNDADNGLIKHDDIIVDDLGNRYQVYAAYWNSLGFSMRAELMVV